MSLLLGYAVPTDPDALRRNEYELCARIRAEFRDMPGLRLTLPQAARLFNIEPARCERVLAALVGAGHLATDGRSFRNPGTGPW